MLQFHSAISFSGLTLCLILSLEEMCQSLPRNKTSKIRTPKLKANVFNYPPFLNSRRNQGSFLFGLPFDLFNDGALKEKKRTQRKTLQKANAPDVGSNPYLSSSGIPVYKYRQKNPLGYGRKKRDAQAPWVLLDPTTGRTLEENLPVLTGKADVTV